MKCPECGQECNGARGLSSHMRQAHDIVTDTRVRGICAFCGKETRKYPSQMKSGRRNFCDNKCQGKWRAIHRTGKQAYSWRGGKEARTCDYCGTTFRCWPSQGYRFCPGKDCKHRWHGEQMSGSGSPVWKGGPVKRLCEYCGEEFDIPQAWIRKGGGRYCKASCRHRATFRGGPFPYGPYWRIARTRARARDNFTCQRCGITEEEFGQELSVHHIRPFRDSYDHRLSNLVTLCVSCHGHCEWHPEDCPEPRPWLALPPARTLAATDDTRADVSPQPALMEVAAK